MLYRRFNGSIYYCNIENQDFFEKVFIKGKQNMCNKCILKNLPSQPSDKKINAEKRDLISKHVLIL